MIAVDTNVLIRILVDDPSAAHQIQSARALLAIAELQSAESFESAVTLFNHHSADFSDCLILTESTRQQLQLFTFDKKLGRLKGSAIP